MNITTSKSDCQKWLAKRPDNSVNLVFTSPPYVDKGRRYGGSNKMDIGHWVPWMKDVVTELVRVCDGPVFIVANGSMKKRCYQPACEGLIWELFKSGIVCDRPCIWHKNPPPNRQD